MMNKISILEILLVVFLLLTPIIAGYLGLRVLKLNKRAKLLQEDRNDLLESRTEWEVLWRDKIFLSDLEKKMILAALNMPEYRKATQDPNTSFQVRKTYRDLREKIKGSFDV